MSTLIPNRQWDEVRRLSTEQLRLFRAAEVYNGEDYIFTLIPLNPYDSIVADNIRTKAEYLGVSTNSLYPLEERREYRKEFCCDECGKSFPQRIALEGHKRSHRKVKGV